MSFAREAWPFVLPTAALAAASLAFGWWLAAAILAVGALTLLLFFRIPRRQPPADPDLLTAPADGRVLSVDTVEEPMLGPGPFQRVATFLSVFNVHVQRSPTAGTVTASRYQPGRKVAAFRPEAAAVNESHLTAIRRPDGELVGVRQIAGLLARRVVGYLERGAAVSAGELLGVIKFGSRVDLYVPPSFEVGVRPGDRLREGVTAVARRRPGS